MTTEIKVGRDPDGVAVNPRTHTIYVTNTTSGTVSVINAKTNTVSKTIKVGRNPWGIAVIPLTGTVYVANEGAGKNPRAPSRSSTARA